ncbi:hypothetical protein BsWGS_20955 [Bradybaena similaris]
MERFVFYTLLFVTVQISSVQALTRNSDIIGMAVAGSVSFVLLSVLIAFIVLAVHWKKWFGNWMWMRRQGRVPRSYIKKKDEVRKIMISGSQVSKSIVGLPDPSVYETVPDVKEWTLGSKHLAPYRIYEDKDATMELGEEEDDDIFTIETEVIEDEAPHYAYVSSDRPEDPQVKEDKEIAEPPYSTSFSLKRKKPAEEDFGEATPTLPDTFSPAEEDQDTDEQNSADNVRITRFNEPLMQF